MLNAATLAAIVAAVWAHPAGVSYLEKIERLALCHTANPCCVRPGGSSSRKRPDYLVAQQPDESIAIRQEDDLIILMIANAVARRML